MIGCNSYCLYRSLRIVNIIVNFFGVAMIIYCLWLLKKWDEGVSVLPNLCDLPCPWFIYVCLAVGIIICFSTLSGHMVANCINKYILAVYIVSIFSLVLIQAVGIVMILFKIDWQSEIIRYIDENHRSFKSFLLFHLDVCRLIAILVLVAQINTVVLAAILWAVGGETTIGGHISCPVDITQSFLTDFNSSGLDDQRRLEEIMKSYMEGIFTRSFTRSEELKAKSKNFKYVVDLFKPSSSSRT